MPQTPLKWAYLLSFAIPSPFKPLRRTPFLRDPPYPHLPCPAPRNSTPYGVRSAQTNAASPSPQFASRSLRPLAFDQRS
jgi:hypothetical protein